MNSEDKIFEIFGDISIYRNRKLFFGITQYVLLKRILEQGSINAAAKCSKISYQQAWSIVDRMNRLSPVPLVIRQKGGAQGGGCRVTSFGKSLITYYNNKMIVFGKNLCDLNKDLDSILF